jgi:hypothetical protein
MVKTEVYLNPDNFIFYEKTFAVNSIGFDSFPSSNVIRQSIVRARPWDTFVHAKEANKTDQDWLMVDVGLNGMLAVV